MRPYSPEDVEDFIREIAENTKWRKEEIDIIETIYVTLQTQAETAALLRMYLPLLYAHWEGSVKDIFTSLNKFLNKRDLSLGEVREEIIVLCLNEKFDSLKGEPGFDKRILSKKIKFVNDFVSIFNNGKISINEKVDTESNLNHRVLIKLIQNYGLQNEGLQIQAIESLSSLDSIQKNLDSLLNKRNHIAHGENIRIPDIKDVQEYRAFLFMLIEAILSEIERYLLEKDFLRNPS